MQILTSFVISFRDTNCIGLFLLVVEELLVRTYSTKDTIGRLVVVYAILNFDSSACARSVIERFSNDDARLRQRRAHKVTTPSRCEHDVKTYKMPSRLLI